jgi:hypothetical protein
VSKRSGAKELTTPPLETPNESSDNPDNPVGGVAPKSEAIVAPSLTYPKNQVRFRRIADKSIAPRK